MNEIQNRAQKANLDLVEDKVKSDPSSNSTKSFKMSEKNSAIKLEPSKFNQNQTQKIRVDFLGKKDFFIDLESVLSDPKISRNAQFYLDQQTIIEQKTENDFTKKFTASLNSKLRNQVLSWINSDPFTNQTGFLDMFLDEKIDQTIKGVKCVLEFNQEKFK